MSSGQSRFGTLWRSLYNVIFTKKATSADRIKKTSDPLTEVNDEGNIEYETTTIHPEPNQQLLLSAASADALSRSPSSSLGLAPTSTVPSTLSATSAVTSQNSPSIIPTTAPILQTRSLMQNLVLANSEPLSESPVPATLPDILREVYKRKMTCISQMAEAINLLQANEGIVEQELNRLDICRRRVTETRLSLAGVEKEVQILLNATHAAGLDIENLLSDDEDIDFKLLSNIHTFDSDF